MFVNGGNTFQLIELKNKIIQVDFILNRVAPREIFHLRIYMSKRNRICQY
jgi:hypothetical protein